MKFYGKTKLFNILLYFPFLWFQDAVYKNLQCMKLDQYAVTRKCLFDTV